MPIDSPPQKVVDHDHCNQDFTSSHSRIDGYHHQDHHQSQHLRLMYLSHLKSSRKYKSHIGQTPGVLDDMLTNPLLF